LPAESHSVDLSYRVGASVLACAAGSALGLLLGCVLVFAGAPVTIALSVVVGAGAGVISGFTFPLGAMDFAEGTVHFFVGFFRDSASLAIDESTSATYHGNPLLPEWLRWAFFFGSVFAVSLALATSA